MTLADWRVKQLDNFGVKEFYYFSLADNLKSILKLGIISKNEVARREITSHSFAEESVQEKRHTNTIELSNCSRIPLHDLVPVYLTPRTPTLSARRKIQYKIFFAVIRSAVLCDEAIEFVFTDGNAGSLDTNFYRSLYKLTKVHWDVIRADYWNEFPDGKRKRNAEFLIYPRVDLNHITRFVVSNEPLMNEIEQEIRRYKLDIPVVVDETYFFV